VRGSSGGCDRHAKAATASVSQRNGHDMIWKSSESLDQDTSPVSNHISVISVSQPDSVSQTEIRSFVRIEMAAHQNSGDIHDQQNY
jgi:hypothetical protein